MKIHEGIFKKKNGDHRVMKFVRTDDLPQEFIQKITKAGSIPPTNHLPEGMEIVWDMNASAFRVFNWRTVVGTVTEILADTDVLTKPQQTRRS